MGDHKKHRTCIQMSAVYKEGRVELRPNNNCATEWAEEEWMNDWLTDEWNWTRTCCPGPCIYYYLLPWGNVTNTFLFPDWLIWLDWWLIDWLMWWSIEITPSMCEDDDNGVEGEWMRCCHSWWWRFALLSLVVVSATDDYVWLLCWTI